MKVKDLMNEDVVAVGPDTPLKDVAAILLEHGISGVPVIGEQREVLGVVSEADIVVKEQGPGRARGGLLGWLLSGGVATDERLTARTASEAMTAPAITIRAERRVSSAAEQMIDNGIKRLPVVDARGALIGIVTRTDLVRAFTRTDEQIAREIRDELTRTLLLDAPELVGVRVERGVVTLTGKVDRRADAELIPRFVARVPGVVDVTSTVEWSWDDTKAHVL